MIKYGGSHAPRQSGIEAPATRSENSMLREKSKSTRVQRSEELRSALFQAAAEVVGECGYADASISKITQRANLAQGTFYNYFESRQHIFDELLPTIGEIMLRHVEAQAQGKNGFLEKEAASFQAFFTFMRERPYFLRILNEAEVFAPAAYKRHFQNVSTSYVRFLQRAREKGEIRNMNDAELEALSYIFMAARGYLAMRYSEDGAEAVSLPDSALSAYVSLVEHGVTKASKSAVRKENPKKRQ